MIIPDEPHSTPPVLWPKEHIVKISQSSWRALIEGQEKEKQELYRRIVALAKQVEKLNWIIEDMDTWNTNELESEGVWRALNQSV